jgi:4-hydroxyphenylpyruvate dioxygenase
MFKWSIATVCLGGTLEGKLTAAARAGFRAVEIFENDLTFFSGNPRDVRRMAEDLGLSIVALQPMRDFEAMPDPVRARNFERARRKFDLMEELGTTLLCICSNVSDQAIDAPERAAEDLAALAGEAAQRGFRIGYEALAWGRHVRDWTAAWDIVRTADQPNLGIVLDSFHACVRNNPLEPIAAIPGDRIALVQVADAPAILMDPLSLSRHHRCFPGQGDMPIDDYLDAVSRSGYRGPVSLEVFNDQFRGASVNAMAVDGFRSLQLAGERLNARRASRGERPVGGVAPPPVYRQPAGVGSARVPGSFGMGAAQAGFDTQVTSLGRVPATMYGFPADSRLNMVAFAFESVGRVNLAGVTDVSEPGSGQAPSRAVMIVPCEL